MRADPVLVSELRQAAKVYANPFTRSGMTFQDALILWIDMSKTLAALPEEARQLTMLLAEGYTQAEIARIYGISVRSLCRALAKHGLVVKRKVAP